MTINYELTKQDYIDFNMHHIATSPTMKRALFIQRFILPILFLVLPIFLIQITDIPLWYWFSVLGTASVLWIVLYPKSVNRSVAKRISKMISEGSATGIVGTHCLSLTEQGIVDKTEYSETRYHVIERIEESEKHIFIYVSAVMAYIIPKRVFPTSDEADEFRIALKKL